MLLSKISSTLSEFRSESSGAATVEFVLILPMLLWLVFSTFEIGWLNTRKMMLTRGVNLTIRDLRLGRIESPTHAGLKALICERSLILEDCVNSIHIELIPLTLSSGVPRTQQVCVDRTGTIEPVESFTSGDLGSIMFIRACVIIDPMLPGTGIGAQLDLDPTGGYAISASSAFKREP